LVQVGVYGVHIPLTREVVGVFCAFFVRRFILNDSLNVLPGGLYRSFCWVIVLQRGYLIVKKLTKERFVKIVC
jgi:hypothetical protein